MRMPSPSWVTTYASDRRKHRHRCHACNKIVQPGETVVMARVGRGLCKVVHQECAAREVVRGEGHTWADLMRAHGIDYLARCGWPEAKRAKDTEAIFRPRGGADASL